MNIITAYQTKNDCYKAAKKMTPKGIVVHSTGTDNPKLSRYVDCVEELGKPSSSNWNRAGVEKMVHGFIGYDKNSTVTVVNTLPYNYCCWGCGSGSKGSYNYSPSYIQFEMCEDDLTDKAYFSAVFDAAADYCAFLCKTYSISIDNIVSHAEAHKRGYASNHSDCGHWLKKFGKDMNWFRAQVEAKMNPEADDKDLEFTPWIGRVNAGSVNYRSGPSADTKSLGTLHKGDEVKIISENPVDEYGSIWVELDQTGWMNKRYIDFVQYVETESPSETTVSQPTTESVESNSTETTTNEPEVTDTTSSTEHTESTDTNQTQSNTESTEQTNNVEISPETQNLILKIVKLVLDFLSNLFNKNSQK